jgi:flagellar motor switch protein FliG
LKEGAKLSLDDLPEAMQVELTHEMGALRTIDKATLEGVVREFLEEFENLGATFSGGLEGALELLDGALSEQNLRRLRRQTGVIVQGDPWVVIGRLEAADIAGMLKRESIETGAVILSKLPVSKSAEVLAHVPGDLARKITYAVSHTDSVDPDTVRTIGHALAAQVTEESPRAFPEAPVARIGAILNNSPAQTRDGVLDGITEEDAELGAEVRKAIFTFEDIADRVAPRDVPKIARAVDQEVLITALAGAAEGAEETAAEFILENMSKRMAAQLREDIEDRGTVKPKDREAAMMDVVGAIRDMEAAGELELIAREE